MNKKFKDLIKDTFIFSLGSLGSKLILFILVPLYTNCLSTEEYGTAELVFTIAQLVIPIASVTVWNGLIRYGLMKGQKPENVFKNSVLIWIFGSILVLFSTPLIGFYSPISEWKWYLCAYSIVYIANQIELNFLKVKGKNRQFALASVLQTVSLAGLNILLLSYLKTGVKGYLLSNILANCVALVLVFFMGHIYEDCKKGEYDRELIKQMIAYSAPLILNDISWWLIHSSDKIMIEWMVSKEELGLYTVAAKIPGLVNTFINIFTQAWGISSIKEIESENETAYYSKVFLIYSTLTFGSVIAFISIIKPFMRIYVGSGFISAWRYVPLLLGAASFSAISAYFGPMFGALKKSVPCMWTTIAGALVNVILNYICIKLMGTWGAIVGTLCAFAVIAFFRMLWLNKYIKMKIAWRCLIIDIAIAMVQGLLVSLNWHIVIVSLIAIMLFLLNHLDFLKMLKIKTIKILSSRKNL